MDIQDIETMIEENEKKKAEFKAEMDADSKALLKLKKELMEKQIEEATKPQE